MSKRGQLLKLCMERDLCNGFVESIAAHMRNLTEQEKEARAQKVIDLINLYKTEEELRAAARQAGFL